jgi:hypothetical protein
MNLKRGLIRCWILFTASCILLTAFFTFKDIRREFEKAALERRIAVTSITLIPVAKADARGARDDCKVDYPWNRFNDLIPCWYELPKFRELFPEYRDLAENDLVEKTYARAGVQRTPSPGWPARPWQMLLEATAFALGVPLGVLLAGASLYWAIAGFAPTRGLGVLLAAVALWCGAGEAHAQASCDPGISTPDTLTSFGTGQSLLQADAQQRREYIAGFINGLTMAEVMGAPASCIQPFTRCLKGKSDAQLAAVLEKYIRERPEEWDVPAALISYNAFHEMCKKLGFKVGFPAN